MTISLDELLALEPGTTIINAGRHAGRREIRGAVRYRPHDLLEPDHLALPLDREEPVVIYGEHGAGDELRRIATKLSGDGFADVRLFEGTLSDYEAAGGATQEASIEQEVPPQQPEQVQSLDRRI